MSASSTNEGIGVFHLLPELEHGGVEDHVAALANAQARMGLRVFVVSGGGRLTSYLDAQVRHFTLPVGRKNFFTAIACARKIASLARTHDVKIIHAHSRVPGWIAWSARLFNGRLKFIYTAHALFSKNFGTWPIGRADAVICVSNAVREDLRYRLNKVGDVRVIYNSLTKPIVQWRGSGGDVRRMICVGRLTRLKNLETIFRALAPISDKSWRLDVLGDGPLRPELEHLAGQLGISDRVSFLGYVDDVPRRIASCDLFLFPSQKEGLPLALLEALSAGVPTLASDIPPNRELAEPNDDPDDIASLLPPTDVEAWTRALDAYLDGERPAMRLKMHMQTSDALASNVMAVYDDLLTRRSSSI